MTRAALALLLASLAVFLTRPSGASFTRTATNPQTFQAQDVSSWLHQYSQSTDPDGLTGYQVSYGALGVSTGNPAATGSDHTLSVGLGTTTALTTVTRLWTVKTPATLPESQSQVTVAVSSDDATLAPKLANTDGSSAATSRTMAASAKLEVNATMSGLTIGVSHTAHVTVTVTFTGNSTSYLIYTVAVTYQRIV